IVSATTNTIAGRISFNMTWTPQARCKALTRRSIALMPMNGMMTPPMPEISKLRRSSGPAPGGGYGRPLRARGGAVSDALQRQRDERDDDQRIEDDRRQDGALRRRQIHNVERLQLRIE